jgi:hypothetical protein
MNIELMGDPFSEQILFRHESLLMPWKRPLDAPNVADIFPHVRQMALDGKTTEAIALALQRMNEGPVKQDTQPHLTIPAFLMKLDLPESASVRNYLRTVNFENSEITVIWTDEHGDWIRRTFTSRPDHVVVQCLLPRQGKTMNVRISWRSPPSGACVQDGLGQPPRSESTDPDMKAFVQLASDQKNSPQKVSKPATFGRTTMNSG